MLIQRQDLPPHLRELGTGRCASIEVHADGEMTLANGYWDGGSKAVYTLCQLATGKTFSPTMDLTNPFKLPHGIKIKIPDGYAIVETGWFCGKPREATFHVNAATIVPALPAAPTLDPDEIIVLRYITSYKSSYAGISNYRRHMAINDRAITAARWEAAKTTLIERRLLNAAGAITAAGRVAASQVPRA